MGGIGDVLLPIFTGLAAGASESIVARAKEDRARKARFEDLWIKFFQENPELAHDPETRKKMDSIFGDKESANLLAEFSLQQQALQEMAQQQLMRGEVPGTGGSGFTTTPQTTAIPNPQFPPIDSQNGGTLLPSSIGNILSSMLGGGGGGSAGGGAPSPTPSPTPAPGSNAAIAQAFRDKGFTTSGGGTAASQQAISPQPSPGTGRAPGAPMRFSDVPAGASISGKLGKKGNWRVTGQTAKDLNLGTTYNQIAFIKGWDLNNLSQEQKDFLLLESLAWKQLGSRATAQGNADVRLDPQNIRGEAGRAGAIKTAQEEASIRANSTPAALQARMEGKQMDASGAVIGESEALNTPGQSGLTPNQLKTQQVKDETEARRQVTQGKEALRFEAISAKMRALEAARGTNQALDEILPDGDTRRDKQIRQLRMEALAKQKVDQQGAPQRIQEAGLTQAAKDNAALRVARSPAALDTLGKQKAISAHETRVGRASAINAPVTSGGPTVGEVEARQQERMTEATTRGTPLPQAATRSIMANESVQNSLGKVLQFFEPGFVGPFIGSDTIAAIRDRLPQGWGGLGGKEAAFDINLNNARNMFLTALRGTQIPEHEYERIANAYPAKMQGTIPAFLSRLEYAYNQADHWVQREAELLSQPRSRSLAPDRNPPPETQLVIGKDGKIQKVAPIAPSEIEPEILTDGGTVIKPDLSNLPEQMQMELLLKMQDDIRKGLVPGKMNVENYVNTYVKVRKRTPEEFREFMGRKK
jgi:hypothetical protein